MAERKVVQYRKALKRMFNTEDGLIVLKYLQEDMVHTPIFSRDLTSDQIMYKLGQRELVQSLISELDNIEDLKQIQLLTD